MTFPSFERIARLYQTRMSRLFQDPAMQALLHNPGMLESQDLRNRIWELARGMATEVAKTNATSWRTAAMKTTRAREIYAALRREIGSTGLEAEINRIASRNAQLISSLPREVAGRVTARAAELFQSGARAAEVEKFIRQQGAEVAKSRIRLIARTEISRAETQLTQFRSERIGISHYQWQTAEDGRVREPHRKMNGVLVPWGDPPSPEQLIGEKSTLGHYDAGCCPQCRCVALPLADLAEVRWPARVYRNGSLTRMSRAEFTRISGVRIAA
ncbi:MAG TPA: phage minor head protein [Candidatus Limnocylindrales bacterium]|nr:phage minor head protein [Candidatus Limnocylindrales bacterium]